MRLLTALFLLMMTGCSPDSSPGNQVETVKKLRVISTTAMINDLVQSIGGEHIAPYTLIEGSLDPHSYQLVKGDDEKLGRADLIFYNGLGLEHGASLHYYLENSPKAVSLGASIYQTHPEKILHVATQFDPHIWMDASLFAEGIPAIVEALSKADPEHAQEYAEAGRKKQEAIHQLHERVKGILHGIPQEKRYLVTSHDAFNYFAKAYLAEPEEPESVWTERFQAPEGLAPDSQISSADIQFILTHIKRYHIPVLFPESNVSQDSIKKIVDAASEQGFHVTIPKERLYGDAMGKPGTDGETYEGMLLFNAKLLERYLNVPRTK